MFNCLKAVQKQYSIPNFCYSHLKIFDTFLEADTLLKFWKNKQKKKKYIVVYS